MLQIISLQFAAVAFHNMEGTVVGGHVGVSFTSIEVVLGLTEVQLAAGLSRLPGSSVGGGYSVLSGTTLPPLLLRLFVSVCLMSIVGHLIAVSRIGHDSFHSLRYVRSAELCNPRSATRCQVINLTS